MRKTLLIPIIIALFIVSCGEDNTYSITENTVGPLTKASKISELSTLFKNDSLVDGAGDNNFITPQGDVMVYEKGGKKLLQIIPAENNYDSKVKTIQVYDPRYITAEGITVNSTFKDISSSYEIRSVENLIGSIVIFVKGSDAYFTMDKKKIGIGSIFDTETKIEISQIPDDTPIKYFQIGWN